MNALSKFLLSIILIFSATITESTFAEKPNSEKEVSVTNTIAKPELDEAFISAVKNHNLEEMQELIEAGADVNAPIYHSWDMGDWDWSGKCSPLLFAIKFKKPEMAKILLQVKNKLNTTLNQALDDAIRYGSSAIVEELIKEGADLNYINENEDTLLILAVEYVHPLQQYGRRGPRKSTRKVLQILLNEPKVVATINHVNKDGRTALMEAANRHDLATVQDLLKFPKVSTGSFFGFGENPINYADKDGNTALILAARDSRYVREKSRKIIQILLKAGANIAHVNKYDRTALMEAVEQENLDMVQELLKFSEITTGSFFGTGKKPINFADKNGNTALILAVKLVRTSFVYGNNREYKEGYNACVSTQKIVDALLKTPGIDPYHANKKGETAIALLEKLN